DQLLPASHRQRVGQARGKALQQPDGDPVEKTDVAVDFADVVQEARPDQGAHTGFVPDPLLAGDLGRLHGYPDRVHLVDPGHLPKERLFPGGKMRLHPLDLVAAQPPQEGGDGPEKLSDTVHGRRSRSEDATARSRAAAASSRASRRRAGMRSRRTKSAYVSLSTMTSAAPSATRTIAGRGILL